MPEIDFSILLPTRHRLSILERLLYSIKATTHNPQRIEVVLYIDEDDTETQRISFPELSLVKHIGHRENMGKITNFLYKESRSCYIMLMNDDVIFRTSGWDSRVKEVFLKFKDNILLVYGNDLYQRGGVGTFPILSRTACEIMGGISPEEYKCSHIDTHLYDIFRKLAGFGHKRNIYLSDVIFEHMHYEAGKSGMDEIYANKNPRKDEVAYISWDEERTWIANRLAQKIGKRGQATFSSLSPNGRG